MFNKNEYNYFKTFVSMADYSCAASKILYDTVTNFKVDELEAKGEEMHKIEHSADAVKHEMIKKLAHEFIPPIEREDIISLAQELDDVTDSIEDVLIGIYMYNVKSIRSEALEFCDLVIKCCDALKKAVVEFENFHKSKTIHDFIVEVNNIEEAGDKIYKNATRRLFSENANPIEILTWREIFDGFEKCCDSCEDVADIIESVIMKNS